MNTSTRTVAFQIPEELFRQLKKYLKKHDLKQKDFVLGLIQQALASDTSEDLDISTDATTV